MPGVLRQGVFLSYRREDAGPYARSLQRDLSQRFPGAPIFMDVDSIEAGLDFAEVIEERVNSCALLVALIGRQWATLTDDEGARRLDNPDDYVRFEVKTALERGVRVIPVLIDGAKPLRRQELPDDLHKLARLNAHKLSWDRYQDDADRLLDLIQRVLAAASEATEADRKAQEEADRRAREEAELLILETPARAARRVGDADALPDPGRSRAVLIGVSTYRHFEDLPAVHNNLTGLRDILINPPLGGLPADKCTILEDPSSGMDVYHVVREQARAAEDTLLVYFAGASRLGDRGELYLCLPDTDPDVLPFTALAYNQLRAAVADGRAARKVVILDCSFSGRALADLSSEMDIVDQVGIEGSYVLTATPANAVALAPPGERYTAFTGALLDLLRTGIPGGSELLTIAEIYPRLKVALTSRHLPQPRQRGSDNITGLALTRNLAYTRPGSSPQRVVPPG